MLKTIDIEEIYETKNIHELIHKLKPTPGEQDALIINDYVKYVGTFEDWKYDKDNLVALLGYTLDKKVEDFLTCTYIHSLASIRTGRGFELLSQFLDLHDSKYNTQIALRVKDADTRLIEYFEELGFTLATYEVDTLMIRS
jgi:hypothetical protein